MHEYLSSKSIELGLKKLIIHFFHQAGGKLRTISNNDKLPMIIIQTFLLFMTNHENSQIANFPHYLF